MEKNKCENGNSPEVRGRAVRGYSSIRANLTASLLRSNRLRPSSVVGLIRVGREFDTQKRTAVNVMV